MAAIAGGGYHTCAVLTTGAVKCWGYNLNGQLGDGTTTQRTTPVDVTGLASGASRVTAGNYHTCALMTSGGVKCWGINAEGELGDGTTTQRTTPVDVSGLTSGVVTLDALYYHTCAVTTTSTVKCWGKNDFKQLSDPTVAYSASALSVVFPTAYSYADAAHKHAVTSLNSGETYAYDANGNMITRVENGQTYTQTFNVENQLISVTVGGQTTQFLYDGNGNMVKKTKPDGSKTIYMAGVYEVDKTSGGTVTRTVTYYPAGGAMRINISGGANTVYYILKDHLGSASVVTDSTGTTVGEQRYYPYGETRLTTGSIYTDQLFTGQREITGLGIYHYGARFYSPKIGRFVSADTIVPNLFNPQDMNRFSYVRNNPLRYTDPTGHTVACEPGDVCERTPLKPRPTPPSPPPPTPDPEPDPDPDPCSSCAPDPTPTPLPDPNPGGGQPVFETTNAITQNCQANPYCFNATQGDIFAQANSLQGWTNFFGGISLVAGIIGGLIFFAPLPGARVVAVALFVVAVEFYFESVDSSSTASYLNGIGQSMSANDTIEFDYHSEGPTDYYHAHDTSYEHGVYMPLTSNIMQIWAQNQQQ